MHQELENAVKPRKNLFMVSKTSNKSIVSKKCFTGKILVIDQILKDFVKPSWYKTGFNHKEQAHLCIREVLKNKTFLEINSLEELSCFIIEQREECIINISEDGNEFNTLEIYDSNRE